MVAVAALGFVVSNARAQDAQAETDAVLLVQDESADAAVEDADVVAVEDADEAVAVEEIAEEPANEEPVAEAPVVVEPVAEEPVAEEPKDSDVLYGVQKIDEVKNLADAAPAVAPAAPIAAPIQTAVSGVAGAAQVYGPYVGYEVGVRGIGFGRFAGRGIALPARQGRRFGNREIVAPSPYANPTGSMQDWARFRNYPYGYYPQNFGAPDMSVPRYNPRWQNYYPNARRFHEGKHFLLDVF